MISVKIEKIVKSFGNILALYEINALIHPSELFFILGPSGCGKTTLLRTLAGFYFPDHGRILFDNEDVSRLCPHRRNTGMVFQNYALWPHKTVAENVSFGLKQKNVIGREASERVDEALSAVQMNKYADRRPNELSGGQQQRVALARALVVRPRCLLLDEPLSNLDAKLRNDMRLEIRRICKEYKLTTIYVTHDQKEALSIADRMLILSQGKVIQIGSPIEIYKRPASKFIASFIGEANFLPGKVLRIGAGEAFVETPIGGFRGALTYPDKEPKPNDKVFLCIRPECFKLSIVTASENAAIGIIEQATYFGEVAHYNFRSGDFVLKISELNPRHLGGKRHGKLYACADPEDTVVITC